MQSTNENVRGWASGSGKFKLCTGCETTTGCKSERVQSTALSERKGKPSPHAQAGRGVQSWLQLLG